MFTLIYKNYLIRQRRREIIGSRVRFHFKFIKCGSNFFAPNNKYF